MARINHEGKIRVAMVGAGVMANRVHYPSLASFPDVEFAGICDINSERMQTTGDKYRIARRFDDYRQMIESVAPDAVYVIGQPHIMYDIWQWCLEHKLNLYIEKPMGVTLHQARSLAYLAGKGDCITQVSFQRRSSPLVVKLHDECLKRGPIVHAVCRFYKWAATPYLDARDHMMDDGVHAIDSLRWACGGEAARIQSIVRRVGVPDINFIMAMIEFDNGATGAFTNSWTSGRRIFDIELHAPGICAEVEHEGKGYLYAEGDTRGVVHDAREAAASNEFFVYGGFQAKHREFINCLRAGAQPGSNFSDAVKTMEVADKILAQGLLSQ